jgi:segregation and condensation protein B
MEPNTSAAKTDEAVVEQPALQTVQDIEKAIEAILFAAGHPITYDKLSEVIGLTPAQIKKMVGHMAKAYENRGIQLLMFPDSCQLCTKEDFAPYIREALGIRRGGNLSASSMEVLAIVAYNQPVIRSFVDTVRGVDSSYAISSLLDKGLIEACGRLEAPGRPMLYQTTEKFLRVFGLNSLADLPETEALQVASQGDGDTSATEEAEEIKDANVATDTATDTDLDAE